MKKYKVNVYDIFRKYLKTLEFDSYDLALSELVSGHWHLAELVDRKRVNYTYNNKELRVSRGD